MGVSSLHCCLAVLLHSFLGLTHPCTVPDFCFLLFCFSFSSCGCLPCDTLCSICRGKKIHNAVHCTIFDILLLGINNLIEYKISYWSVNPHSCWDQKKKSILPVLGFNQRERNDEQKWEPAPTHLKKSILGFGIVFSLPICIMGLV